MPEVSIIMSTYKEPVELLRLSIDSILKQTYDQFEFIIVIDSPDNTSLIAELERYASKDFRIVLLKNQTNIGLTASLNRALKVASGYLIARMDADDIAEADRLEKQISYLERYQLDLVGCEMRRISEDGTVIDELTNKSYAPEVVMKLLKYDDCVAHPSWLVKRSVYDEFNGYKEIFSCEDYYFLLRALYHGKRIGICDSILMNYRINTKGISRNNSLRQLLSAHYLQKHLKNIDKVTQRQIECYLTGITEKQKVSYEKAVMQLNRIINRIKCRHYLSGLKLIRLPFQSKFILLNYKKIFIMAIIKKMG